ncbi:MAG TPA: YtxH domain-containing protein [Candidatus Saccharimonadales bacterium]|jgi:gas vesicle protein|nr:YtxH domain-containing protein [Candidatus Saccharimonadales bacterium]
MKKGKFALGALIGAVAGVIAGVLTAPKSGKETRADIRHKAEELKSEAVKRADEVKSKSTDAAHDVKVKAGEYKTRGERTIEGVIDSAKKSFFSKESKK